MSDLVDGALTSYNESQECPTRTVTDKNTGKARCCNLGDKIFLPDSLVIFDWSTEYTLDHLIQEALKFATHSKRPGELRKEDVQKALEVDCYDPLCSTWLSEKSDMPVPLKNYVSYPEEPPTLVCVERHWLAIEGVQPNVPQNPSIMFIARHSEGALPLIPEAKKCKLELISYGDDDDVSVPDDEAQRLYDVTVDAVLNTSDDDRSIDTLGTLLENFFKQKAAQRLEDKVTEFISDQVKRNLGSPRLLERLVVFMDKYVLSQNMNVGKHADKFIPPLLSCIVTKNIGGNDGSSHFEIRSSAAKVLSNLCRKNGPKENKKIIKTLTHILEDPKRVLPACYGALVALHSIEIKALSLSLSYVHTKLLKSFLKRDIIILLLFHQ